MSLLSVRNLSASYGPSQALFDVSLEVGEGQVVAMLGRNGMGKTTTIKSICRMLPYRSGEIVFDGQSIARLPAYKAVRGGIGLVPEGRRCFANLTVHQNLAVAARSGHWDFERVTELFPRLAERRNQSCATLSGGEQQMVAISRALMTNPRLLILDEATEGLAPLVRKEIWDALHALKSSQGLSILVVDKSIKELSRFADSAVILQRGETVWQGPMKDLTSELTSQYIGV